MVNMLTIIVFVSSENVNVDNNVELDHLNIDDFVKLHQFTNTCLSI